MLDEGFQPWMDDKNILPGEEWDELIQKEIKDAGFFLPCLSKKSINKRGYFQKEINIALDLKKEKLQDDIYIIPVRFDDCQTPGNLNKYQAVETRPFALATI